MEVDVGADNVEEVKALGTEVVDQVAYRKRVIDLVPDILAARAVDDRAGCAAFLAAAVKIDRKRIKGKKATLAWSLCPFLHRKD